MEEKIIFDEVYMGDTIEDAHWDIPDFDDEDFDRCFEIPRDRFGKLTGVFVVKVTWVPNPNDE